MEHLSIYYLQEHFRNQFGIHINPMVYVEYGGYWVDIQRGLAGDDDFWKSNDASFPTYEKALNAGINKAKEILSADQIKELEDLSSKG